VGLCIIRFGRLRTEPAFRRFRSQRAWQYTDGRAGSTTCTVALTGCMLQAFKLQKRVDRVHLGAPADYETHKTASTTVSKRDRLRYCEETMRLGNQHLQLVISPKNFVATPNLQAVPEGARTDLATCILVLCQRDEAKMTQRKSETKRFKNERTSISYKTLPTQALCKRTTKTSNTVACGF